MATMTLKKQTMTSEFTYRWPDHNLALDAHWQPTQNGPFSERRLPENREQLEQDSRWPAFFPSPICLVTTTNGQEMALEKVVGPSIVNRFPYIAALSFCRERLSSRHHVRSKFTELLEAGETVAIQFLDQGEKLSAALDAIQNINEDKSSERFDRAGLTTRPSETVAAPTINDAYLVYEGRLVKPGKDFAGDAIFNTPYKDVGSHRVYFIEITTIQLRDDIATGKTQISWKSLPEWTPGNTDPVCQASVTEITPRKGMNAHYEKGFTPNYNFPNPGTIAFERDKTAHNMAIKFLEPLPEDQVEIDNDRARWPCFFPSPTGMITTWTDEGAPNLMPCGSTTIISRHPLTVAPCISYSPINERYAPRVTLDMIRNKKSFGCGVAYIDDNLTRAIRYTGTTSYATDKEKVKNGGFEVRQGALSPHLTALPIHFECQLIGEVKLGTHIMLLGEVKSILVRDDLNHLNPMRWQPWGRLMPVKDYT